MKLVVNKTEFLKSLSRIYHVVEKRNCTDILDYLYLETNNNHAILKATDREVEVIEKLPIISEQTGVTMLPAYLLHDIIRRLPDKNELIIEFNKDENVNIIKSGQFFYRLKALEASRYEGLEVGPANCSFSLSSAKFKRLLDCAAPAMSNNETRYSLNGLQFCLTNVEGQDFFNIVGTDGKRLSLASIEACPEAKGMAALIVPRKMVVEMQKLLGDNLAEEVNIETNETSISLDFGHILLRSKLVEGNFPPYENVIPKNNDKLLIVDREEFISAANCVSAISTGIERALIFKISKDGLGLEMDSGNGDIAKSDLECEYEGEGLTIGFCVKYLQDMLGKFTQDHLVFSFKDSMSACVMRDGDDKSITYVLMPMRV